jgi:DNA mismatch repair protein MutL
MEKNNDSIEVLAQSVVEKIAAGEIIERPASVLKELIENALDAGASKIDIAIEDSGFASIRVTDNGRGMTGANLQKSVVRHATSKIRSADDLYAIETMGFRGEALASIAAVSRMTIAGAVEDGLGYAVESHGGKIEPVTPISHVKGVTVTARDLFFNVPARKKFMKTRKAERIALMRCIEQVARPFPSIHFTAAFEGRPAIDMPAVASIPERIAQLAGVSFAKDLIACFGDRPGLEATIYISSPETSKSKPRFQNLYVNRRKVESDQVLYAIREAFHQFTKSEFKPSFFCFITVDPARIDVNVHPTKLKVKFEDEKALFGFIFDSARRGISAVMVERGELLDGRVDDGASAGFSSIDGKVRGELHGQPLSLGENSDVPYGPSKNAPWSNEGQTMLSFPALATNGKKNLESPSDTTVQLSERPQGEAWNLIPCYQIHNMFILAPIKNGILLIDQHAAHERILYEQALEDLKNGRSESQQLLFPIIIEFSPTEKSVALSGSEYFSVFGFEILDFGGNAVSLSALPAFLKDSRAEAAVRDMVRYLLEEKTESHLSDSQKRFAAAFACGAAIKAGQKLSQEEMNALLNSLFASENPYICPHGRPTLVRMSLEELSRRFLR